MSHHSSTGKKDGCLGCAGCSRPDEADNMVQCDSCDAWWHFSCAGVTGSITDRMWLCTRCKRNSRASSRVSVASRSSSHLADSMARLRERQELEKQRADVELEKKFLEEQRRLLEATIAAEEEKRSRVSREDSLRRVQDWIGNSADPGTSAVGEKQPPAASELQQHTSQSNPVDSEDGAVGGINQELPSDLPTDVNIQHSSPLRDRTIPNFDTTGDISALQPVPLADPKVHRKGMDMIRELRTRLEHCLEQSEPTTSESPVGRFATSDAAMQRGNRGNVLHRTSFINGAVVSCPSGGTECGRDR